MKVVGAGFIFLISLTATCALYGWLESSVNMIEGLRQLIAPGATTVVFSPILLLFILLQLAVVFVAIQHNAWFLLGRPPAHPASPAIVLAILAGANAALNLFVAALIIRKMTAQST